MQFTYLGQKVENVYHVRFPGDPTATDMVYIAQLLRNWWVDMMKSSVPNTLRLNRVVGQSLVSQGALSIEHLGQPGDVGAKPEEAMPSGVTAAVKWGTGLAGRSFRGRTYHLGLVDAQVVGNQLDPTFREGLRGVYDALRTALDNATLAVEFVVVSRRANNAWRVAGITTPISGVSVDADIDFQRRRLAGRGQ
jgi:hypothetical protein